MTKTRLTLTVAALGLLLGGRALAENMPRLPQPMALPQTGESPGVVKFDHSTHVDSAKPSCASCHPMARGFSILGRSSEHKAPAITHARMEKGESCGACHGKKAFNFDDCTMCHAQ